MSHVRSSSHQLTHQLAQNAEKSPSETSQASLDEKKCLANPKNHEQNNIAVVLSKRNLGVFVTQPRLTDILH